MALFYIMYSITLCFPIGFKRILIWQDCPGRDNLSWWYCAQALRSSTNAKQRSGCYQWGDGHSTISENLIYVLLHANELALVQAVAVKITQSQEHGDHEEWKTTPSSLLTNTRRLHLRLRCLKCLQFSMPISFILLKNVTWQMHGCFLSGLTELPSFPSTSCPPRLQTGNG